MVDRPQSNPELPEGESWGDYRHHVLGSLGRLENADATQTRDLQDIKTALAVLTTKVTLYAAGVALTVSAVAELAVKLIHK